LSLVHGEVRVHVEHTRIGVAEEAEAATAKCSDRSGGVAPLLYLGPGIFVIVECSRDHVR
jgi:hypothetical protein